MDDVPATTPEAPAPPSHGGRRRPWKDLPTELLRLIILRVPSHASRIRLRAVCRSWCAGVAPPLPPLLPWATLRDGTFLSLSDGDVHRIPFHHDIKRYVSTGSMLYLLHNDGRCSLVNPFSQVTSYQHADTDCCPCQILSRPPNFYKSRPPEFYRIRKTVVMSDHIITLKRRNNKIFDTVISICQPQSKMIENIQWLPPNAYTLDVARFEDKLYVLAATTKELTSNDLYVMDIISEEKQVNLRCIINTQSDDMAPQCNGFVHRYLVTSGNRLLMVKQLWEFGVKGRLRPARFQVFEAADLSNGGGACWRMVDTLMGSALFLHDGCSGSLLATGESAGGAQEDCIYFLSECEDSRSRMTSLYSGMYNMREGTMSPLPFQTVVAHDGPWSTSWLFPIDT